MNAPSIRPHGLRSTFEREARGALEAIDPDPPPVTRRDLAALPEAVRVYLDRAGVVGRPRPTGFRATFDARIRGGPDDPWMEGTAEQVETFDPVVRLFFMRVRRGGLPVKVFHRYTAEGASLEARLLGLFPVMRASGPKMMRSETVTLLNDVFFLAPGALVGLPIEWSVAADGGVGATFTHGGWTVSAIARFDDRGDLVDFESRDRYRTEADPPALCRWSTPFREPVEFDGLRLPSGGEARWGEPGEEWSYGDFRLRSVRYGAAALAE